MMRNKNLFVVYLATCFCAVQVLTGYAATTNEKIPAARSGSLSPHGTGAQSTESPGGMVAVIKNIKLDGYPGIKIGEVFERYRHFNKKEWVETKGLNGNLYVDFYGYSSPGWFDFDKKKAGVASRGIEVKFAIYPNGSYSLAMVSKVEVLSDGKTMRYPLSDIKRVLDAIYANKKID